jgi:hypothetical protein
MKWVLKTQLATADYIFRLYPPRGIDGYLSNHKYYPCREVAFDEGKVFAAENGLEVEGDNDNA